MSKAISQAPLKGIRVIDFGQYIAGPAVAMMLAEQGAEVIRVDPPSGPSWHSPAMAVLNRGKKSIVLDLKVSADKELARKLIASADVVIENFRPGVMDRLGLGPEEMVSIHPQLIYLSLPGFSAYDMEKDQLAGWEGIIAAATGWYRGMGMSRILMGVDPSYSPLPLASIYGALLGALSVTVALYAREQTGRGDIIEVPLAAALSEGLAYNTMSVENMPNRYKSQLEQEIERRRTAGEPMNLSYEDVQGLLDPFYRDYLCADGRYFYHCCPSHKSHAIKVLELLGLWEEMVEAGIPLVDPYLPTCEWPEGVDCSLLAFPLSAEWAKRLSTRMQEVFLQKTSFEWERIYGEEGIPSAAQRTTKEWLNSEHAIASGLIIDLDDPVYGRMKQPGQTVWFEGSTVNLSQRQPAPVLDANRAEILASLSDIESVSEIEVTTFAEVATTAQASELPLKGIRILDLTNVIAGPTIASTLARFGAEVIKLDPPNPAFDPSITCILGLQGQRGKRSALIDLKTPQGQEILARILRKVDVVTFNGREGQLKALGIDPEQIHAANPKVILCRLDAFGGPNAGPRSETPGFDETVQASTGMMARFGGSLTTPELHANVGTIDVSGGYCGAFAVAIALINRLHGATRQVARTSLAVAGQLIQLPFMYHYEGRKPFAEPSGPSVKGEHALYRLYEAQDAWFFLAAGPDSRGRLTALFEFADIESVAESELVEYLAERFRSQPADDWINQLGKLGLAAHKVENMAEVRSHHLHIESARAIDLDQSTMRFIRHDAHPSGYAIELVAPNGIRMKHSHITIPEPAPKYGKHTRQILRQIGFDDAQINQLLADSVVSEAWSRIGEYIPS
ncbi:CaiB/BaiF CoA transferase family protein [Brevibacillus sp. NRS-1366]|uniref:CaiB/BaiF CoA transferase family protein n=1 Tax=Brevibacillus sp. NRS-1366 TaxID=3233899 RepID=UPI003D233604